MHTQLIPTTWLPPVIYDGIVVHWTAGNHIASDYDKGHYHFGVDGPGLTVWRGVDLRHNAKGVPLIPGKYAAHTAGFNGGKIGFTLSCMGSTEANPATENNFVNIRFPMTKEQWDLGIKGLAELCVFYNIPVRRPTPNDRRGVMSHAEVQEAIGVPQAGKWDFTRLSWKPELRGAKAIGDFMRAQINEQIQLMAEAKRLSMLGTDPADELLPAEEPQFETVAENRAQADPMLPNPATPAPAKEPMSDFRKIIQMVAGIPAGLFSILAAIGAWFKALDPMVALAIFGMAGFFVTAVVITVLVVRRPIVTLPPETPKTDPPL